MMHPNFYHWHNRVELKPDTTVLQARWDAAAKFSEELSGADACSLLRLALFGVAGPEFTKRFSEVLVTLEPTFPPEGNAELLRVMSTAALFSKMDTESVEADALALGLRAAEFHPDRITPVCKELGTRGAEYLASESERMRPTPDVDGEYQALKKTAQTEGWENEEGTSLLIGKAVLELGETMGRISEENQYLWWLLGRRSSLLNTRREKLSSVEYALVAGAEAAERVAVLPPPASVESLIAEVLTQCAKASTATVPVVEFIDAADVGSFPEAATKGEPHELCALSGLVGMRRTGSKIDGALLEKLHLPKKLKVSPSEVAIQFYRELMFLRALAQLD